MTILRPVIVLMLVSLAGCSDSPKQYPVHGEVLLDGQPLAEGTIIFHPQSGQHDADVAEITTGRFSLKAAAGAKRVEIKATKLSTEKTEPSALGGDPVAVRISIIPERYNRNTKLTAEVTPSGPNAFRFDLTSDE